MKKIRFISAIMSFIMILGVLANLTVLPVFAAEDDEDVVKDEDFYKAEYLDKKYETPETKVETMKAKLENNKYIFYMEETSGEWALYNKATKQYLFSNPYNTTLGTTDEKSKMNLLSQVIVQYSGGGTDQISTYTSFEDCVMRNQLKVKNLKNGIRVEYTIGNEETRKLLPMQIEKERFETQILPYLPDNKAASQYEVMYSLLTLKGRSEKDKASLLVKYPALEKYDIYVYATDAKENEKLKHEALVKNYCPHYSFEELENDHAMVGYVSKEQAPAVFKFAIEYRLDVNGVDVRLGANGIRFDESVYTLENLLILPYAGAGMADQDGYMFIPDGSGAIIEFDDVYKQQVTITGKLYGQDYAFHEVTGTTQKSMRLPVYGVVQTSKRTELKEENGFWVTYEYPVSSGFVAIVEEGESFSTITATTGGSLHNFNTVYTSFNPRPSDVYKLSDAVASAGDASFTVHSDRKYIGNYRVKFIMLEDPIYASDAAKADAKYEAYEATYVGMANAYRDYLYETKQLTLLTDKDVEKNIPLYIETFGTIDTLEKFLSFPITVETPLTTFDNLKTIYTNLNEKGGIDNINFKLTGFANGGMTSTVPSQVDIQDKVGGNKGFKEFLSYAGENGIGVYPDFDFVYLNGTDWFDGFGYRSDAVRTMDDRYTQKRVYDPVFQTLLDSNTPVISVSAFTDFYKGFKKDFVNLGGTSISVSTIGSDLNSDFNEDDPYNREDSKDETVRFLETLNTDYSSVMSDAGNAYVFKYVDHLLNVTIDSSRYVSSGQATFTSHTIPFVGMVLHGSIEFAGTPMNNAGDIAYEVLRSIENGANPYFMVSYQNLEKLKDNELYAEYYSVRYDVWEEDLIKYYKILNEALKDVQTSTIVDHEFIQGVRVPTEQEAADDKLAIENAEAENAINKTKQEEKARRAAILQAKIEAYANGQPLVNPSKDAPSQSTGTATDAEVLDVTTKYLTQKGTIVKVTYSNEKAFVLNYNNFEVSVGGIKIKAYDFAVVDADFSVDEKGNAIDKTEGSVA